MTLSLSHPQALRTKLAAAFDSYSSVELGWRLGQLSDTPSTAFFIGYQAAMRCLDSNLSASKWAAFAVSEKGVRNPYQCQTFFNPNTGFLKGTKSHVMLASAGLDLVYILAKEVDSFPIALTLLKVDASSLQVEPAAMQPFMQELPHHAVSFSMQLPASAVFCVDAHQQANKPFRYWEDVHAGLALSGWLQNKLTRASKEIEHKALALMEVFRLNPYAYDLNGLDLLEQLIACAQTESIDLSSVYKKVWQRDTMLFKFSQVIRDQIRQKLLSD